MTSLKWSQIQSEK